MSIFSLNKISKTLLLPVFLFVVFSPASFAKAQSTSTVKATTPAPTDLSARTKPYSGVVAPTTNGTVCKKYNYQGGVANLSDCTAPDGSIETCIQATNGEANFTVCDIRDASGKLIKQNGNTLDSAGGSIDSSTDVATGETTTSYKPSSVANVITGAFDCAASGPIDCTLSSVAYLIMSFANLMLGIAGILFNFAIVKTVFQFSQLIGNSPGLLVAWGILRDVGNMLLLFGFIFMGVGTILDLHSYNAKKSLPFLIIFAVLMNFSLFAAEAVIDTSNVFSTIMYSQANTDPCVIDSTTGSNACGINQGIAGHIMQSTGLSTIHAIGDNSDFSNRILVFLGLALFATIGAVVLFAGAIMIIFRAVILTFLMVTAPIGFAGMAIPMLHSTAKKWWHELINQAFFAPVFLLCIFVSLKITDGLTNTGMNGGLAAALTKGESGSMAVFLIFAMVIGFLVASLMVAKKMGAAGAGLATNAATKLAFGGVTLGTNMGINLAGRGLVKGERAFSQSRLGRKLTTIPYIGNKIPGFTAGVSKEVFTRMESANVDLRRVPGVGTSLKEAGAGDGAKASTGGLTLGGVEHLAHEYADQEKARDNAFKDRAKKAELEQAIKSGTPLTDANKQYLLNLGTKQLETMHGIKEGEKGLVKELSPEQFEALLKSDKLSQAEKDKLVEGRYADLSAAVAGGIAANIKAITRDMSKGELENIPSRLLALNSALYPALTDAQREDLSKSKKRTDAERQLLRKSSDVFNIQNTYEMAQVPGAPRGAGAAALATAGLSLKDLTVEQVAKLSRDILVDPDTRITGGLSTSVLIKLGETNKLNLRDMETVGRNIRNLPVGVNDRLVSYVTTGPGATIW